MCSVAPIATLVPSELKLTEYPKRSLFSPIKSPPNCVQPVLDVSLWYIFTIPSSELYADPPFATIEPSDDKLTECP